MAVRNPQVYAFSNSLNTRWKVADADLGQKQYGKTLSLGQQKVTQLIPTGHI